MRKFAQIVTVLTAAAAFAPLAAHADVGTSIYQPGPTIVHAQPQQGRTVHAQQVQAIQNENYAD